jgi:large subunit ribosomal protein L25
MKKDITITAEPRATRGKNEARRMRAAGKAPAVLYGAEKDPVAVAIDPKQVVKILMSSTGHNTIFDLDIAGVEKTPAMILDWQVDPVKEQKFLHIDLKRIDLSKEIAVKVPVHHKGEARGVKVQGGLLEVVTREIEIRCLPNEIPEFFEVDVTELTLHGTVRAGDIPMAGSMKLISPADSVLLHVVPLRAETEAAPAEAGAEAAQPEVIKKGKKEEAAPAEDKKKK